MIHTKLHINHWESSISVLYSSYKLTNTDLESSSLANLQIQTHIFSSIN